MGDKPVFHYFNGRGRGETVRLMMAAAGVDWTEAPYLTEKAQFQKLKDDGKLLFGQVPLLQMDGVNMVQAGACLRHVARKYNMDGKTLEEKVRVDMLTEGAKDFYSPFMGIGWGGDDAKAIEGIKSSGIPKYMPIFEKLISESKSGFLVGDSVTMADVALLEVLLNVQERCPEELEKYPKLKTFFEKACASPRIDAYLKSDKRTPMGDAKYVNEVKAVLF